MDEYARFEHVLWSTNHKKGVSNSKMNNCVKNFVSKFHTEHIFRPQNAQYYLMISYSRLPNVLKNIVWYSYRRGAQGAYVVHGLKPLIRN